MPIKSAWREGIVDATSSYVCVFCVHVCVVCGDVWWPRDHRTYATGSYRPIRRQISFMQNNVTLVNNSY